LVKVKNPARRAVFSGAILIKFFGFKQKMVDNILNLYYLKIMMGEDIKHGEKKLHIGKERWAFREKAVAYFKTFPSSIR